MTPATVPPFSLPQASPPPLLAIVTPLPPSSALAPPLKPSPLGSLPPLHHMVTRHYDGTFQPPV